jgi:hypothetical protein
MHDDTVIYTPKHTNHLLHLILTFATCGMWGFVWAGVAIWNAVAKDKSTVRTPHPRAWYAQPIARPYDVGPGAPVGALNPHPATPAVAMPPMPPYVGLRPGYPTNMATPQVLPALNPQPMLVCGHRGCGWSTSFEQAMTAHREVGHLPPIPPQ